MPESCHVVDIALDETNDGTKVTLTQSNLTGETTDADRASREDYEKNWRTMLDGLKATAERSEPTDCRERLRTNQPGARGVKGWISSGPGWITPQLDSGTSFQAPSSVPRGSETTSRVSSPSPWKSGFSG